MTLHDSLEIGNVVESGWRILLSPRPFKNDILYRTTVCEKTYRHHTIPTAKNSGQHFVRGRHSSNETGKGDIFSGSWYEYTSWDLESGQQHANSDTKFIRTQVHILVPLGLSFTWLAEAESPSSVNVFWYAESSLVSESEL